MTNDKQRERLVELLKETRCERSCDGFKNIEVCNGCTAYERHAESADYILADGWMRPPCKVGDIVYFVARNSGKPIGTIDEIEIVMIGKTETGFCAKGKLGENTFDVIPHFEIDNYTFFASREEAEAKLKEGVQG